MKESDSYLVTLEVLMLPEEKQHILLLKNQEKVSSAELLGLGAMILTNLRRYC